MHKYKVGDLVLLMHSNVAREIQPYLGQHVDIVYLRPDDTHVGLTGIVRVSGGGPLYDVITADGMRITAVEAALHPIPPEDEGVGAWDTFIVWEPKALRAKNPFLI